MKIALIGAEGQLGRSLAERLEDASQHELSRLSHKDVEITDAGNIAGAIEPIAPEVVINAAAWNRVDAAEDEPQQAMAVNALGPRNLALFCRNRNAVLLHVSTDYVFSGRVRSGRVDVPRTMPYREIDRPEPCNLYGISKLAGEHAVRSICPRHFILRTCGLYGPVRQRGRGNFVETMLRIGRERGTVRVVDDQRCTPTATAELAGAACALLQTKAYGLYHATCRGSATWYEFARCIFERSGMNVDLRPVSTAEYGARAARPAYSVLDCSRLASAVGFPLPHWRDALEEFLSGRL